ncbi:MAG: SDR family NAD(P)-dependent oxidoreductase [Pelagibacterales bacterium]|nr:SDR family NAD(P)-dependent oxidoreductase [Pelagibacterales bacterium]
MKSIVITGTSTGIGYASSKLFIENGYRVFGSVRNKNDADKVSRELGSNFIPLIFDVTDEAAVKNSVKIVEDQIGDQKLSGLINNAGLGVIGTIQSLSAEEFKYQFDVNVLGVFHCCQAYLDLLGADKNRKGDPGKIINISSISGEIGMPFMSAYNMSKFGLEGFSEGIRRELLMYGIDVVVIAPGPVKTPIWKKINQKDEVRKYDNSDFRVSVSRAMKMTEKMEQAGCEPSVIAERALSIIKNTKNKTRYRIDPTRMQNIMLQMFPKRVADRMIAKRMKIINK